MNFRTAARVAVHLVVSLAGCFVSVTGEAQRATYHDVDSMEAAIALFDGVAGGRMRGEAASGSVHLHVRGRPRLCGHHTGVVCDIHGRDQHAEQLPPVPFHRAV